MPEDQETTDKKNPENSQNPFVEDVLKRASITQNLEPDKHITLRGDMEKKEISFDKLINFVDEIPQESNDAVRYIFLSGWERELILQAENIMPLNVQDKFNTKLKKPGSKQPISPHGDIDYLWMSSEYTITRNVWEKYHTDGGKSTLPVKLLYYEDLSRREPGTNQPDPGALEKYCCRVTVNGREFIVPRPELVFLEYAMHKQALRASSRFGETIIQPEDRDIIPWSSLLLEIDKKYSLDLELLEEARSKLIKHADDERYSEFNYLATR